MASQMGNEKVVKYLLSIGANPNTTRKTDKVTPLSIAAEKGFLEVVKDLYKAGADPNIPDSFGIDAMFTCAQEGHVDILDFLYSIGCDINRTGESNRLTVACEWNLIDVLKYLISHGANLKSTNHKFENALHVAQRKKQQDLIEFLKDSQTR